MKIPAVSIVIPHYNGEEILRCCLESLRQTVFTDYEIIVVDNGSTDNSVAMIRSEFSEVQLLESPENLGYAGGCNLGIRQSCAPFVVLLNNDTEVSSGWLGPLLNAMQEDESVAAVQPKIRSIQSRNRFDYCGAAGGEIDIFGYPFARGRIFHTMEEDNGQYDSTQSVFWATGAAVMLRRAILDKVGLLDASFFAHMEEIDLCWRFHLVGCKVLAVPDAIVYHQTGGTLDEEKFYKMVLNHRNNLLMMLRNYSLLTLLWIFPMRIFLEILTLFSSILLGQPKRACAVIWGLGGVLTHWKSIANGRKQVAFIRSISDDKIMRRMYRKSIALEYFLKKKKKYSEL